VLALVGASIQEGPNFFSDIIALYRFAMLASLSLG
jgi:hypothetical protein